MPQPNVIGYRSECVIHTKRFILGLDISIFSFLWGPSREFVGLEILHVIYYVQLYRTRICKVVMWAFIVLLSIID